MVRQAFVSYIHDLHTLPQGRFDWKFTFCLTRFLYISHPRGDIRVNHVFSLRGRSLILMPSLNKIKDDDDDDAAASCRGKIQ